jgi:hypothetical protein
MAEEHEPLSTSSGTAVIEYMKPNFEIHNFSAEIADSIVHFQVLKMD